MEPAASTHESHRHGLGAALALGGALLALGAYAILVEPRWLKTTRDRIRLPGLPPSLAGLRIALLTDLHAGRFTPLSVVRRATAMVMEARPHLVAVTGDLAGGRRVGFDRALKALDGLSAPLGVYAVPGNHDYVGAGIAAWRRAVRDHPTIHDLTNRYVLLETERGRICVTGVADLEQGAPDLSLPPAEARDLTILLAHQPDYADLLPGGRTEVDLMLAGHTHGGQIRLPGLGPLKRKSATYDEGPQLRPRTCVYTSRGVGTSLLPLRFGARPEVVILELVESRGGDRGP